MLVKLIEYSIVPLLLVVFYVWGSQLNWELGYIGRLELFPLFGLIAFVTMWWHFLIGFAGRVIENFKRNQLLHKSSSYWVFISFILHPALIAWYANDLGYSALNSPSSGASAIDFYKLFVGAGNEKFVLVGYLALVAFIAYDIARWLRDKEFVKKYWKYIESGSDIAFIIIWLHALNIGRHLQSGWFKGFWVLLGLSGAFFIGYRYWIKFGRREVESVNEN